VSGSDLLEYGRTERCLYAHTGSRFIRSRRSLVSYVRVLGDILTSDVTGSGQG
jgi:hypothetical protein